MTTDWKLLDREQRGVLLAATVQIKQDGGKWVVPSQSGNGRKYVVIPDEHSPFCSCPDHEINGHTCKHILAVRLVLQRELFEDGSEVVTESLTIEKTTRRTYPQQWKAYNAAQTTEKETFQKLLAALCEGIQEPAQEGRGQRRLSLSDAVFSCCFKVYSTVSGRRFMSDLRDAQTKGHIGHVCHFNSIFNYLESENMTAVLRDLISRSSEPLSIMDHDFAVDSTGFMVSRFHRWFDEKYGKLREKHDWVKAHIAVGTRTHVVTAVEISERYSNDSPIMPALLEETAKRFQIMEVSADKAYASENNFQAIAKVGATAFIPFKSYTTGAVGGLFAKAFHYFNLHRETFLAHYHKRSNVESAIMSIKTKFGDSVRSKTDRAMRNEVLCKILCHNICCLIEAMEEFGIPVDFSASPMRVAAN
jgi:transposase/predicted nucleic acid-binding Zn finger protein